MAFPMNMMDSARGIPSSQAAAVAAMGSVAAYQAHQAHQAHQATPAHQNPPHPSAHTLSIPQSQHQQQQQQHAVAAAAAAAAAAVAAHQPQQLQESLQKGHIGQQTQQQPPPPQQQQPQQRAIHESDSGMTSDGKVQEMTKDEAEGAFTPPPRVASVGSSNHHDARVEKGTDTTDFEPLIKVEIRGIVPGINSSSDKDKNSVVQLHFNSVNEVLHYFSQRTVPQLDAFNLFTNPDLVRNINPELVRNHFLYVPSCQEGVRVSTNGYAGSSAQTPPVQGTPSSPVIVTTGNGLTTKMVKQERRRGEVPPGTIIHRNIQLEPLPNQFVCWLCGLDLQKSLPFEEHMVDQHNVEKPYKCDDCTVTFKRKAHLDRHRRIHLPTRPYQCAVCGKGFTRNEHVRRHSFTHSGEKPYNCPTCNKTFSRREHLTKHLLSHTKSGPHSPSGSNGHPQTPGEYEYMYSPAESPPTIQQSQLQQMMSHLDDTPVVNGGVSVHPGLLHLPQFANQNTMNANKQQRQCQPQGIGTTVLLQTTDQNGRLVTINQSGNIPVSGSIVHPPGSSISYQSVSSGSSHARNQNGEPVARPYQCGVCGKAFIRNEHLRRHVLTHSGEKPHTCNQCGKAFSRREHLTKHIRSHNKGVPSSTQSSPPTAVPAHSGIQVPSNANPVSLATPQVSLASQTGVSGGMPNGGTQASSAPNQPAAAHTGSVAHSMAPSHPTPVPHAAHLPPGTHYLPMFSLLAEVV